MHYCCLFTQWVKSGVSNLDKLAKSEHYRFNVIPAKAGIQ